jgi:hypothetical protein
MTGRAMAQAVSRRPLAAEARFAPGSVHAEIVVGKIVLGQVLLRVVRYFPVNVIPLWHSTLTYLGDEQQTRWWPQFRDIVSSHRHEQQQVFFVQRFVTNGPKS